MKTTIWTLFVTFTLIWTVLAFLAAGLARWTSDAIASDLWAETTQSLAITSESVTRKFTDATARITEQVTTTVTQAAGSKTMDTNQQPVEAAKDGSSAPTAPILPPLPEWVNQWLPPETVRSIEEWGVWANSAANAGKTAMADAANASARALPKAVNQSKSTTNPGDLEVEASHAVEAADVPSPEIQNKNNAADVPWLATLVGWLVPIVWVIWGTGLIFSLLLTLIAQWGAKRLLGSLPLKPASTP